MAKSAKKTVRPTARKKKKAKPVGGPFLSQGMICEQVIEGKDGVMTFVRVIDRMTLSMAGGSPPAAIGAVVEFKMVLGFKSGDKKGKEKVRIVGHAPDGSLLIEREMSVLFQGEEQGPVLIVGMTLGVRRPGLFWFDVYLGNKLMTKLPLRLAINSVVASSE